MLSWFRRDIACEGGVLFRGPLAPRPEELDGLKGAGIEAEPAPAGSGEIWRLRLRHRLWGAAEVCARRDTSPPPVELLQWDPRLSQQEKEEASASGSVLSVRAEPQTHDVLRDRKVLLRFLRAVLGSQGLVAMDTVAQACWSRGALDEELCHDAALDISALFTVHMVYGEDRRVYWLHSHGLDEIGFCDFDLIDPHESSYRAGYDALRGLAFAIVEGQLVPDGAPFPLVTPGGTIALVSARRFQSCAPRSAWPAWRESVDDEHLDGHAVVCEPAGFSWFGLARTARRPAAVFVNEFPGEGVIRFSNAASALMAERARNTYAVFRSLREELDHFSLPSLVKLGYRVDGGGENEREHLWFEVHDCREHEIEGTLLNQPFGIARLNPGDRGVHPADLVSEWRILSPFGSITPSFGMTLREIRSRPDEMRRILRESRAASN